MLTIHHLQASQSDRIIWLCEELGLAYELKSYARDASKGAPAAYKSLSPFGTAPLVTDGDWSLGESGAIVEYLCMARGGGRLTVKPDEAGYEDYLFWFHFANGSLVPALMIDSALASMEVRPDQNAGPSRSERAIAMIETRLGQAAYFAGEQFTAADIMMCLPRFAERIDLAERPNLRGYLERITARDAWRRTDTLR